jgi:hypothetical protein
LRDPINVSIENAVSTLLPMRRAGDKWERNLPSFAREVLQAAGGPEALLAWAGSHSQWRFNAAEAPREFSKTPAAHAEYVVKSVLEEMLDREIKADKKAGH